MDWSPPEGLIPFDVGQEHTVWFGDDEYVYKLTKKNHQGITLVKGKYGGVDIVQATPSEYFERVAMQNDYFGDDTEVIGFKKTNDALHIATKQSFVAGSEPTDREIESFLKDSGFKENMHGQWEDDEIIIADVHSGNFIKKSTGDIVPIDLIVVSKKRIGL